MAKILIADHDRDYRELVIFTLRFVGYVMVGAESGKECIAMAKEHKPDLILMELDLPDMSFVHTYKEIISVKATDSIPVVFLLRPEEVKTFHTDDPQMWGTRLLLKSLTPDQLTRKVNQILRSNIKAQS